MDEKSGNNPYIFISYAHKDTSTVLPIIKSLGEAGFSVWYDEGIEAGTEWPEYVAEKLYHSTAVVAFISKSAIESQNCRREINYAISKRKDMLTVYLEDLELSPGMEMQLGTTQALFRNRSSQSVFLENLKNAAILAPCRNGGGVSTNLIPELQQLAQENINFSHNEYVGGFREVSGASWTIGAMVAHTAGVPLKVPEGITDWQNGYGTDGTFLPGLSNLHTILAENGYNQALMVGSDATFGGRKTYYETHGINKVYDYYTARDEDRIFDPYHFVWWGYEDHILFDYAKTKITEMAAGDQPFAFTMLTVDTHHIGGYKCTYCGNDHEENYENVIACASRQVAAFVAWLQEQPFYENTTIIITGDHCSMDNGYFSRNVDEGYTRHIYNCFINSAVDATYTQNRSFSALDMFPTTLAAMGCTIEGDRLGLGTNLFSATPTLIEKQGYVTFWNELAKASDYYNRFYEEK